MNITDEQIEKLSKELGLKKLQEIIPDLRLVFDEEKIYIYDSNGEYYKLHKVNHDKQTENYALIDLYTSNCYANGKGTAKQMMDYAGKDLFVFDTVKEFAEWLYKQTR